METSGVCFLLLLLDLIGDSATGNRLLAMTVMCEGGNLSVAEFEDAVLIALDGVILFCAFEAFFGDGDVFFFALNADVVSTEFCGCD